MLQLRRSAQTPTDAPCALLLRSLSSGPHFVPEAQLRSAAVSTLDLSSVGVGIAIGVIACLLFTLMFGERR